MVPFALDEVVAKVASSFAASAAAKGLSLDAVTDPATPTRLLGDPLCLGQVLSNLVSNAIKFTASGSVRIAANAERITTTGVDLAVTVSDTGIGLSPEQIKRVFDVFTQADVSTTCKYSSSGLGLSSCKHLLEMMGGDISVESKPGGGCVFRFTLHFELANGSLAPPVAAPVVDLTANPGTKRILLVEDNDVNQQLVREIIRRIGITVDVAENGEEALKCLATTAYDLVLMDIQMPVMDGYTATQKIRAESRYANLPIVAMTANALAEERDRCLAYGMNDFITKPIQPDVLRGTVAKWLRLSASNMDAITVQPAPKVPPDVVVVDQEVGLAYADGNRSLYVKLAQNFCAKQRDAAHRVHVAWEVGDRDGARRIAHSLKGMAGTLGARQLALAATELEQTLKTDDQAGNDRINELIECFSNRLDEALSALSTLSP